MKQLKILIPVLLITLLSLSTFAQENTVKWLTNYEEALAISKKENKPILMNFSGSDWCANCMRLEKVVFNSNVFKTFSEKNFVLLKLDFPAKRKNKLSPEMTKQNDGLAEKFNKTGAFPTVTILAVNGKLLGTTGYKKMSAEAYIIHLQSFLK
jgi:thioredoxin-related protein